MKINRRESDVVSIHDHSKNPGKKKLSKATGGWRQGWFWLWSCTFVTVLPFFWRNCCSLMIWWLKGKNFRPHFGVNLNSKMQLKDPRGSITPSPQGATTAASHQLGKTADKDPPKKGWTCLMFRLLSLDFGWFFWLEKWVELWSRT